MTTSGKSGTKAARGKEHAMKEQSQSKEDSRHIRIPNKIMYVQSTSIELEE